MISNKVKLLAVGIVLLGATSSAFACGDEKKDSGSQASYTSTEKAGASCCTRNGTMASATVASADKACAAKMTSAECAAHMASSGCSSTAAKSAMMAGDACTFGENTVTMAGACPAKNEADYAFYVAGAECRGTGSSVARTVKALKGVASVTVDYDKHMVYVCADGKAASKQSIAKSLKTAGYDEVRFVNASKDNCAKSHGKVQA